MLRLIFNFPSLYFKAILDIQEDKRRIIELENINIRKDKELQKFKTKLKQTNFERYVKLSELEENYNALKLDFDLLRQETTKEASKPSDSNENELAFNEILNSMTKLLVFGSEEAQEKDKITIAVNQTCDQETPSINETLSQQWVIHKRKFLRTSTLFECSSNNIWKFVHEWNVKFSGKSME